MSALLQAVWPAVSAIDWAWFCNQRVSPYDDFGVPKYTGLLMHRSGGGCVGANTVATGFLPRPEKSAAIVAAKTGLLELHPEIRSSMERRNPKENQWGGGVRTSDEVRFSYAITGLPEIGDHLLVSCMMRECSLLTKADWHSVTAHSSEHMLAAREYVDMTVEAYNRLNKLMFDIIQDALAQCARSRLTTESSLA